MTTSIPGELANQLWKQALWFVPWPPMLPYWIWNTTGQGTLFANWKRTLDA